MGNQGHPHDHQHGHHDGHGHHGHDHGEDHDKEITIIVNGRQKTVTQKEMTEAELVKLAFDNPPTGELICFTITYRRGQGQKPEGTLEEGEKLKLKDGMIINVTATDKS